MVDYHLVVAWFNQVLLNWKFNYEVRKRISLGKIALIRGAGSITADKDFRFVLSTPQVDYPDADYGKEFITGRRLGYFTRKKLFKLVEGQRSNG